MNCKNNKYTYHRVCPYCNKEFEATFGTVKYCSDDCKKANRKIIMSKSKKKYDDLYPEKVKEIARRAWLKKNGITEISTKGKKSNETRKFNNEVRNEVENCTTDCLLKEFGDIE